MDSLQISTMLYAQVRLYSFSRIDFDILTSSKGEGRILQDIVFLFLSDNHNTSLFMLILLKRHDQILFRHKRYMSEEMESMSFG